MHYYQHDINKFLAQASRLPDSLRYPYLLLQWHYLETESSLPDEDRVRLAIIAGCQQDDLDYILTAMFRKVGEFWMQPDLENILLAYRKQKEASSKGGKSRHNKALPANVKAFFKD